MRVLELFSGTGSVGTFLRRRYPGCEIVSLDRNPKWNATHTVDIMDWDYRMAYPPHSFDVVWASPDCRFYSQARRVWIGRMVGSSVLTAARYKRDVRSANRVVRRVLDIISYLAPRVWVIENPQTGLLKNQRFMRDIPYADADYCMYSRWGYRKRTRFWSNVDLSHLQQCNKRCGNMIGSRHRVKVDQTSTYEAYRIPERLLKAIFDAAIKG